MGAIVPAPRDAIAAEPAGLWPIDDGGVSGLACRSPEPPRWTHEAAAHVRCGIGLLEGSVSESGRLCHKAGGHEGDSGGRTRMLAVLYLASDGTLYITSSELVADGGTLAQ